MQKHSRRQLDDPAQDENARAQSISEIEAQLYQSVNNPFPVQAINSASDSSHNCSIDAQRNAADH